MTGDRRLMTEDWGPSSTNYGALITDDGVGFKTY